MKAINHLGLACFVLKPPQLGSKKRSKPVSDPQLSRCPPLRALLTFQHQQLQKVCWDVEKKSITGYSIERVWWVAVIRCEQGQWKSSTGSVSANKIVFYNLYFNINFVFDQQCLTEYRFCKKDFMMLASFIGLNRVKASNKFKYNLLNATCFVLKK